MYNKECWIYLFVLCKTNKFSLFKKKVFKKFSGNSNILDMYIVYHDC